MLFIVRKTTSLPFRTKGNCLRIVYAPLSLAISSDQYARSDGKRGKFISTRFPTRITPVYFVRAKRNCFLVVSITSDHFRSLPITWTLSEERVFFPPIFQNCFRVGFVFFCVSFEIGMMYCNNSYKKNAHGALLF